MNGTLRSRWLVDALVGTVVLAVAVKGVSEAFTDDHLSWLVSALIGCLLSILFVSGWYAFGGRSEK